MVADVSSSPLRVVIVDDEALARSVLREYLSADSGIEIVAECANGFEAVKAVTELQPDLIFLDVQMPKLDGFEVLELLEREIGVIFVTAYDEYALRAFQVHAVDYLLKPYSPERLQEALTHARNRIAAKSPFPVAQVAAAARRENRALDRLLVKDGSRVYVIPSDKIDFVEAMDDYVGIRSGGRQYLKQQTLSDLEKLLDPDHFVRIHRSYLLNIDRLNRIELMAKDSRLAILNDGAKLPVSRSGYAKLKAFL